jgi:hypothetical protein
LVPLFPNEGEIDCAGEDVVEAPIMLGPIQLIEPVLIHPQAGHQAIAQEVTQAKELVGIAMLIDTMLLGAEHRIVG